MKLALYNEYVGSQRNATDVKLYAVAEDDASMQKVIDSLPRGWSQYRWRVENWDTGETLLQF